MKKLFSVIMCVLMVMCFMPTAAFASGETAATDNSVASVTTTAGAVTYYDTLATAISSAQSGDTITLLKDLEELGTRSEPVYYDLSGKTLDLGGHTYRQYNFAHVFYGSNATIKNGTMIAVPDENSTTDKGQTYSSYALGIGYADGNYEANNFTAENLTLYGGVNMNGKGTATLKNLNVSGGLYYAVWADTNAQVTIESGSYSSEQIKGNGVLAIATGEGSQAINVNGGTFTVKSGKALVLAGGKNPSITGGIFNADPTAYVKAGTCVKSTTTDRGTTWAVGHDYTWVIDAAEAATCTEAGKTEGKHCSICGAVLVAQQEIPAHHDLTKTEAKTATYSAAGNKEYYTCSVCKKKFWDSEGTSEITEENSWVIPRLTRSSSSSSSTKTDSVTNTTETTKTEAGTTEAKAETKATVGAETKTAADGTKTTTATVDTTTATKIVEKAVENKSEEVVVTAAATPVAETAAGTTTEVAIPAETVSQIAEKTTAAVTIESEAAKVTLDQEAVAAVAETAGEAGTVSLVVETKAQDENKVEVELKLETSNGAVSDFKGGTVSVTVKLNAALAAKPVMCVYIDDNGVYHKVAGQKNADGTYTFQTGHFSTYAILPEEEADAVIAQQADSAKEDVKALSLKASSTKTKKGNIKVTLKVGSDEIKDIEALGYTVKYKFYRSTKKASGYKAKFETSGKTYTNTTGKKGTRYYYKARVMVYDSDGTLIAKSALKQCKYASRIK